MSPSPSRSSQSTTRSIISMRPRISSSSATRPECAGGAADTQPHRRPRRKNVKSGCKTCKARKVKCDEARPACQRCVSSGQVCEGYGIWGGGGNPSLDQQQQTRCANRIVITGSPIAGPMGTPASAYQTAEDGFLFERFRRLTAPKLPASFRCGFWDTLVLQASAVEPSITHAVLALTAIHTGDRTLKSQQQRALHHYIKAIQHLVRPPAREPTTQVTRQHFDSDTSRVVLIACIIFVCLELLQSHVATARIHLVNGLDVLRQGHCNSLFLGPGRTYSDEYIYEAFARLHLQVELFRYPHQEAQSLTQFSRPGDDRSNHAFTSIKTSWLDLGWLMNEIFRLTAEAQPVHSSGQQPQLDGELVSSGQQPQLDGELVERRRWIQTELDRWLQLFKALKHSMQSRMTMEFEMASTIPAIYHTMARILADTCLDIQDETIYDSHTQQFELLLAQLEGQKALSLRYHERHQGRQHPVQQQDSESRWPDPVDSPHSVVDLGCFPPLYYTGTKCRVHNLRWRAVELLDLTSHSEGLWDARTTSRVTRKVVEWEESGFYHDQEEFPLNVNVTLPVEYRLRQVEVVVSGSPVDKISLFCRQNVQGPGTVSGGDSRVLVSELDFVQGCWKDHIVPWKCPEAVTDKKDGKVS